MSMMTVIFQMQTYQKAKIPKQITQQKRLNHCLNHHVLERMDREEIKFLCGISSFLVIL